MTECFRSGSLTELICFEIEKEWTPSSKCSQTHRIGLADILLGFCFLGIKQQHKKVYFVTQSQQINATVTILCLKMSYRKNELAIKTLIERIRQDLQ